MPRPAADTWRQELSGSCTVDPISKSQGAGPPECLSEGLVPSWLVIVRMWRVTLGRFRISRLPGLRGKTAQVALFSQQPSEAPRHRPLTEKSKNREVKSLIQGHTADKLHRETEASTL